MSQPATSPAAEVNVDCGLVRTLLKTQHPDLAELPLEELAAGWDNVTFRLGEDMAVRVPRRLASVAMLEHEQRWLPTIAAHLPLPVPSPLRMATNILGLGASCRGSREKPLMLRHSRRIKPNR